MKKVEDIFNTLPDVVMTKGEKARLKGVLSAFIASHPVHSAPLPSPYARFSMRFANIKSLRSIALILIAVCGGASALAQGALPGDPLYTVKVNVNEQISGVFAFSPQAKAEHESSLAATRLQEAADLLAAGKLTSQNRDQIEARLKVHVQNVQKNVDQLELQNDVKDAVEVNSDLVSTLHGNEKVLHDLNSIGSVTAQSVGASMLQQIADVTQRLATLESQVSNDDEISVNSENQAKLKSFQAEGELTTAKHEFSISQGAVAKDVTVNASSSIQTSILYLADGYKNLAEGVFNRAFINFQTSVRFSKEAVVILKAGKDEMQGVNGAIYATTTGGSVASSTASTTLSTTISALGSTTELFKEGSTTSSTSFQLITSPVSTTSKSRASSTPVTSKHPGVSGRTSLINHVLESGL